MKTKYTSKVLLFLMIIALFVSSGCSKKDDEPSNTDLLVKEWNVISIDGEKIEGEGVSALIKFENNGNCIYTMNDEGDVISFTFKWSWGTNEETLNMNLGFGGDAVWTINKLTTDALWFYDEDDALFKLEPNK